MLVTPRFTTPRLALLGGLLLLLCAPTAHAQTSALWTDVAEPTRVAGERQIVPTAYRTVRLDRPALADVLAEAPPESAGVRSGLVLSLPTPDGGFADFRIVESPIMAPGLQARYPEMRTYLGQGITKPSATVRISDTPKGFRAMVLSPDGTVLIDPYATGDDEHYMVYAKADYEVSQERLLDAFANEVVEENPHDHGEDAPRGDRVENGEILRTYRLVVAATGEYTIYHSEDDENPTVEEGLEAIVIAMARVNGIYERDVAIRMELIEENDQVIYTDPATDPYTNNSGGTMLGENQTNLDDVIGSENYDIGHVFSTGGGGIAGLGVVCGAGKARGVTGLFNPINDIFYVDYVAHEIGHQYRGNHTFNSTVCGGNRNASTAYEPGAGSTIMAYAGLCGPDNLQRPNGTLQNTSDDYFHNISLTEIVNFVTNLGGSECGTTEETGNTPPEVTAEGGYSIPVQTPFVLSGSGTDAETPEALTYTWEAFDLGPASAPPGQNNWNEQPPFFRSFGPTEDTTRTFPLFARQLAGQVPIRGEGLPLDSRTLRFRFTARDNAADGGGISDVQVVLFTDEDAGPFAVTFPNEADLIFPIGSPLQITWDVAGTDGGNVDTPTVDILYSDDNGENFIVIAEATENDGAEVVSFPEVETTEGRILIRAVDNIFFDVNDEPFSLAEGVASETQPDADANALSAVYPNPFGVTGGTASRATFNLSLEEAQQVRVSVFDALGREVAVLHDGTLAAGQNRQFALHAAQLAGGVYFVRAVGETFTDVQPFTVTR